MKVFRTVTPPLEVGFRAVHARFIDILQAQSNKPQRLLERPTGRPHLVIDIGFVNSGPRILGVGGQQLGQILGRDNHRLVQHYPL